MNVAHTMKPGEFPSATGAKENPKGTSKEQNPAKRQIPCLTPGNILVRK